MHYFIDGYNLLFRLMAEEDDLQSQRKAIIQDLNRKISLVKIDVSIVFDATYQMGEGTRSHFDQIEILYTSQGETADEFIIDEIKNSQNPQQETVITSDKKLAFRVRNRYAHTESVENFMLWLNRAYKNKLRQLKREKEQVQHPASPNSYASVPKSVSSSLIPAKDASLEACEEYYMQAFEAEWQEILKEEERREQPASSVLEGKPPPRQPKKRRDPFESPQTPEEKSATEMERWLKIFENR